MCNKIQFSTYVLYMFQFETKCCIIRNICCILRNSITCHSRTRQQDGCRPLKRTNPVDFHLVPNGKISLTRQGDILHFLSDFFSGELDKFVFLTHPKNSQFPPLLSSISLRSSPLISIHLHYFSIIYYQIPI